MNTNLYLIKSFLLKEYKCNINIQNFIEIYNEIFCKDGSVKNHEKFQIFNKIVIMIFGLDFTKIIELSNKSNLDSKHNSIFIESLKEQISQKDKEITTLRESNEELRTNYWNLKHKKQNL